MRTTIYNNQGWHFASPFFFISKQMIMSNNKGCNPFGGCIGTLVAGYILTLLLIGAVDSCDAIGPAASKSATEGLLKFFMTGSFFVVCYALISKD
jgi:hypothetical protein